MRIISWNVNGMRAVQKKGFAEWLLKEKPDVLCLQETKAEEDQLDMELRCIPGYRSFWCSGVKKGYSGVANKDARSVQTRWHSPVQGRG
jgi:exodeoxyribonuclease-3